MTLPKGVPLSRAMLGAQVVDLLSFGEGEDAIEILSCDVRGFD
jgi:hypothetical protein